MMVLYELIMKKKKKKECLQKNYKRKEKGIIKKETKWERK
jgi:hypothetical protein